MGNVFFTEPDINFIEALAIYLIQYSHQDPLSLANTTLYLPSRRACLKLTHVLQDPKITGSLSFALPKMYGLNDLETIAFDHCLENLNTNKPLSALSAHVISPLKQTHLIARLIKQAKRDTSMGRVLTLAKSLLEILNEIQRDGIKNETILQASKGTFFKHYEANLSLLNIVMDHYPRILCEWDMIDPLTYKKMIYQSLSHFWKQYPNRHFIIAGITQFQKDSISLIHDAEKLDNTTLILPFIDKKLLDDIKNDTFPLSTSPHFHSFKIVQHLKNSPSPLPITSKPFDISSHKKIIEKISKSPFDQAKDIKKIILEAIENGYKSIAVVLPKRSLATRLKAEFSMSNLTINDSSTLPLDRTDIGSLLKSAAKVMSTMEIGDYIQLLKHPFLFKDTYLNENAHKKNDVNATQSAHFFPKNRQEHLNYIYAYEIQLRSTPLLSQFLYDHDYPYKHILESLIKGPYLERVRCVFDFFFSSILNENINKNRNDDLINDTHKSNIIDNKDEIKISIDALFSNLEHNASFYPALNSREHYEFFEHALQSFSIAQPAYTGETVHINIIGLMEARVERCDLIIITGLEEGTLPRSIDFDPWLSPNLRRLLHLALPDELEGLQAQDFFIALTGAPCVVLSHCIEEDGLPTMVSRFWHQVKWIKSQEIEMISEISKKRDFIDLSPSPKPDFFREASEIKERYDPLPAIQEGYLQPPCPPQHLKPKKLSISAVKLLMEDSYGFYAKYILMLRRLVNFEDDNEALIFGQLLHQALDHYLKEGHRFAPQHVTFLHDFITAYFKKTPLSLMQKERLFGFCSWLCHNTKAFMIQSEVKLEKNISVDGENFIIYGTADRLDYEKKQFFDQEASPLKKNGHSLDSPPIRPYQGFNDSCSNNINRDSFMATLIDYKTGIPPTQKAIKAGFAPQLPLEGWLLGHLPEATELLYIHILSKAPFADIIKVNDPISRIDETEKGLNTLLSLYYQDNFIFYPTPNPNNQPLYSDYHNLERQTA